MRTLATASWSTGVPIRWPSSIILRISLACKKASTCSEVRAISRVRILSSKDSRMWVTSVMSVRPKVDAPPLSECAVRKMASRHSGSGAATSTANNRRSFSASNSSASSKNTWKNWLISIVINTPHLFHRAPTSTGRTSTDHFFDHFDQALRIEGLDQPAIGAGSAPLGFHFIARFGGQHQNWHFLIAGNAAQ